MRITAELWETHYWDHASLMVVDHPSGTEVFVDERFARRPPRPGSSRDRPASIARPPYAIDQGRDVTELVHGAATVAIWTTSAGGFYQGITRDHWVEIEIGDEFRRDRPLRLVGQRLDPSDRQLDQRRDRAGHANPNRGA